MRCCVEIDPDRVYAVLDNTGECLVKSCRLHVVLILTDAYRFRVDLDQLRKRVLKPSCNRHRASLRHIEIREFVSCQL
ncbi:uncharacterized protein BN580_02247 [Candidatus Colimorpha enterica]|uniref:Uncharacterized protein n=1 Tax=Candidatus Colimorpha enterica TaxID=3083063 RepID=R6TX78_9BACT|nr:uncharacterized protein BN580_02247 [Candidatus Colimorpha enterica]